MTEPRRPLSKMEKFFGYLGSTLVFLIVMYLIILFLIWITGKALP